MLTAHHDCEFREVLDRVGDKWSLLVIAMLEQRPTPRARFSELKRSIPGDLAADVDGHVAKP